MTKLQQAQEALQQAQNYVDSLKAQLDPLRDLKQAYSEGAKIEVYTYAKWEIAVNPPWSHNVNFRIKDDISIDSWNKHQDLIKQWWNGVEIEVWYEGNIWEDYCGNAWLTDLKYRVKQDKWKLPECEDGSEWVADGAGHIKLYDNEEFTKAGRRRATRDLAERCAKASKQRDLLEAWRDYMEPEWKDKGQEIFYIYKRGTYGVDSIWTCRDIGTVYGSKETMTQICKALNKGDISLED